MNDFSRRADDNGRLASLNKRLRGDARRPKRSIGGYAFETVRIDRRRFTCSIAFIIPYLNSVLYGGQQPALIDRVPVVIRKLELVAGAECPAVARASEYDRRSRLFFEANAGQAVSVATVAVLPGII